jgi:hypothetical protein
VVVSSLSRAARQLSGISGPRCRGPKRSNFSGRHPAHSGAGDAGRRYAAPVPIVVSEAVPALTSRERFRRGERCGLVGGARRVSK